MLKDYTLDKLNLLAAFRRTLYFIAAGVSIWLSYMLFRDELWWMPIFVSMIYVVIEGVNFMLGGRFFPRLMKKKDDYDGYS